ncbi:MAG: LysM peptidoglycan-binding domain-containing protein, partial [Bacteroidota bacterium]
QKLYLTSKKPKGEKILILTPESQASPATASTKPIRVKPENPKAGTVPSPRPQISETRPIIVPQPTAGGGSSLPDADQPRKRWVVHTVRGGDTLWGIAQLYGTKVAIIKQINKLGTDNISEGMQLRILAEIK